MNNENVLLGALLDRLGKTQAQALLVRLDQWLAQDVSDTRNESSRLDSTQLHYRQPSCDRRKSFNN